jgi:phenylacetate-CoA ligase
MGRLIMGLSTPDCYDEIESASRDELQALQLDRMRWSLKQAYENVPHYKSAFDKLGVVPADLKDLSDLSRFPLLSKQDMRNSYPFGLFATPMKDVIRLHSSTGTTGNPVVVGHTQNDIAMWTHVAARSLYAVGARAEDFIHIGLVYSLKTGAFPIHYGAEKIGCTVVPASGDPTEKHVKYLLDFKPRLFISNRSQVLTILDEFERMNIDPREAGVEIGLFGGETGSKAMREIVAKKFGIEALEIYGLTEVCGAGMSTQTPGSGDGITIWEDYFYPEIIDPSTGETLPDGEYGELVITSLKKEASPIIRYRTKDITAILPPAERSMRRLAPLKGRADDIVVFNGKSIYPLDIEQELLTDSRVRPFYQFVISEDNNGDKFTIDVEMSNALAASDTSAQEACSADLIAEIKDKSGISVELNLKSPMTYPRGPNKSVRLVDQR